MNIKDISIEEMLFANTKEAPSKGEAEKPPKGNPNKEEPGEGGEGEDPDPKEAEGKGDKPAGEGKEAEEGKDQEGQEGEEGGEGGEGEEGGDGDETMIGEVIAHFGLDPEKIGEVTDDVDGLSTVASHVAESIARNQVSAFFKENPEVARLYHHIQQGGNEREYFEKIYSGVPDSAAYDISEESGQTEICVANAMRKGNSKEDAEALVKLWKENGQLEAKAKAAKKEIDTEQKNRLKEAEEQAEQQRLADEADRIKTVEQMREVFKTGNLGRFKPSRAEMAAFERWMFLQDAEGFTARDRMMQKQSIADRLAAEYAIFKGFKNLPYVEGGEGGGNAGKKTFSSRRKSAAAAAQGKTKTPAKPKQPDLSKLSSRDLLGF